VGGAGFQVQDFLKANVTDPHRLRIFLSWGHGDVWSAPKDPRWAFACKPYLYKLYVVRDLGSEEPVDKDLAAALLKDLLPQLKEVLFTDTGKKRN